MELSADGALAIAASEASLLGWAADGASTLLDPCRTVRFLRGIPPGNATSARPVSLR